VEYKYVKKLPVRANVKIDLSAQQQDWLKGRHAEGRAVAVIVGSPEGGFVLEGAEWERYIDTGIPVSLFRLSARDKAGIAEWICAQVLV
jgi:16S rRNA U1498 N3-methylase RsmE